jgi:hypothetical protein
MPSPTRALGFLIAVALGLVACSSGTTVGSLGFIVADSLLVVDPFNAASGAVVLSSGTGTCAALQSGAGLIPPFVQVGNLSSFIIELGVVDASGTTYLPLTAGSYPIIDANSNFTPPGPLANALAVLSDNACGYQPSVASGGSAVLSPFDPADGGSSTLNYSAIFGSTQVTGTYTLTTCPVPDTTPGLDAGSCLVCAGATPDGGACAIP